MATVIDELVALLGFSYDGKSKAEVKAFEKDLDKATKRAYELGKKIGDIGRIAGLAVAGGIGLLGKGVIDTSAEFEGYATTLETIEGSAEKAKSSLDWLSNFAEKTPYEIGELTQSFVKLRAYGIDPMNGTMENIGNMASAMGKSLDQGVEAFADAMTNEFERLKEFGIKAKQEGDNVTFTYQENGKEVNKTVKKNGTDILKFLNTYTGKFAGAMDKQSKTWKGMMSNLSDYWTAFKRMIGEAGFFDFMKKELQGVLDAFKSAKGDGSLEKFAKYISDTLTTVAKGISMVTSRITKHLQELGRHWDEAGGYVKAFGWAMLGLMLIARPLMTVMLLLGLVIDDFLTYLEGGDSKIEGLVNWIRQLTGVSKGAAEKVVAIGAALAAAFILAPGTFIRLAGVVWAGISLLGPVIAAAIASWPITLGIAIAALAAWLIYKFKDKIWENAQNLTNKFVEIGTNFGNALKDGFLAGVAAIVAWLEALPGKAAAALKGAFAGLNSTNAPNMGQLGSNAGKLIGDAAKGGGGNTVNQGDITINQTVTQATDAPGAAAKATAGAVKGAAAPSRMQTGPAQ